MNGEIGHDVLGTSVNTSNGAISAQLGDSSTEDAMRDGAEWWQHVGFASRPSSASPREPSCQVVSVEGIDRDVCIASRDLRTQKAAAGLGPGETMLFAAGPDGTGTGIVELKDDDATARVRLSVRRSNDPGQPALVFELSSEGKITATAGQVTIEADAAGTAKITAGPATLTIDQAGTVTIQATSIALGGAGGLPGVKNSADLVAFFATVASALTGLGIPVTPPTAHVSTTTTLV